MRLPGQIALIAMTVAACASAAARRPTLELGGGENPGGVVAGAFAVSGAPPSLRKASISISRRGEVDERLSVQGGAPFELAVPDFPEPSFGIELENRLEGDRELSAREVAEAVEKAQPPYREAEWTSRAFTATVDGVKVQASHRVLALPDGRWIAAFAIPVARGTHEIRIGYRTAPSVDDQGAAYLSFDPSGWCTFAHVGESEIVFDVGDLPATHVPVLGRALSRGICAAPSAPFSFHMQHGQVRTRASGRLPPILRIRVPAGECRLESEGPRTRVRGTFFPCLGVRHEDPRLENWARALPKNAYDARSLALARNWIFALTGRQFTTEALRTYFQRQSWYQPDPHWTVERLDADTRAAVQVLSHLAEAQGGQ